LQRDELMRSQAAFASPLEIVIPISEHPSFVGRLCGKSFRSGYSFYAETVRQNLLQLARAALLRI